jgi:CubicO group peptidase (beta-lactamase class C family)
MFRFVGVFAVGVATLLVVHQSSAQNLAFSLLERYFEPLRQQAGIPGLSAAVVQDGQVVWARGFGHRDVESAQPATPDTPYYLGDLTQTFTATLLMQCVERGEMDWSDPLGKWVPLAARPDAQLRQVLSHTSDVGFNYRYDPSRFALLTSVVEACGHELYRKVLADEILDYSAMTDAVPGRDVLQSSHWRQLFDQRSADLYAANLARLATPYRVDKRGRPSRSDIGVTGLDAAHGVVASARDLANYDRDLDNGDLRISRQTLDAAWTNVPANGHSPMGLGWFVQNYQGERLVWHFGSTPDAYSSLILKIPARRLTLILLANSDGLSVPFDLPNGDVTSSLFARTFLRLFI